MKRVLRIVIPLAAVLLVTAIIGMGALQRMDRWAQDTLFQHRGVDRYALSAFKFFHDLQWTQPSFAPLPAGNHFSKYSASFSAGIGREYR